MMNRIEKMKYSISYVDINIMAIERKDIYELFPDGRVVFRCYQARNRKCVKKDVTTSATSADYHLLCSKLESCISEANHENLYVDDTSAELKLYLVLCQDLVQVKMRNLSSS